MASSAAKESTLPLAASATPKNEEDTHKKRRFHKVLAYVPTEIRLSIPPILSKLGIYFGVYLSLGTAIFYCLEDEIKGKKTNDLIDSLYLCVQTMTTVGYGDLDPDSFLAKTVCSVFATVGMYLVGVVVKLAASYLVEKQEDMLIRALHLSQKIGPVDALKQIETTKISYKKCYISAAVMLAHMFIGIFMLMGIEKMDFLDAVYCTSTTMTTVGYGDESFSTALGRLFGIAWISSGTTSLGQLLLYLAEAYVEGQQIEVVKLVLSRRITNIDLEAADHIGNKEKLTGATDSILQKLKEMGKISQDDIALASKEFQDVPPSQKN
ncbi:hypothetical protein SLEP1_g29669 [Rubroshorea leprosula]|nr:hypothetical protein SLEP1_g29669 [Rubroshorea leprosula]